MYSEVYAVKTEILRYAQDDTVIKSRISDRRSQIWCCYNKQEMIAIRFLTSFGMTRVIVQNEIDK